jgi:hypothetical protein
MVDEDVEGGGSTRVENKSQLDKKKNLLHDKSQNRNNLPLRHANQRPGGGTV